MNTVSEDLFHLIHSLSKSEKRNFKLFSSIEKGEKQYMKLFDLIVRQKKYDEEAIIKKLEIPKSVFAVYKNHLYHLLLQKMSVLHSSKEAELRMLLTQADFLYSKGLYPLYDKMLRKAKKTAHVYDMDNLLLEILSMEHRNAWRKRDLQMAQTVMEEDKKILKRFNNQRQYTHLSNEIIIGLSTMDGRNIREAKKLKALMKNPLMSNDKYALTFRSRYSLYHTQSLYYSVHDNPEKQYHFAKRAVELYLNNPEKIKLDTFTYLLSLHLMLTACHTFKKYDEGKIYIDKLQEDSALLKNEREKIWAFFTYHDTNLHHYIKTGQFSAGVPDSEKLIRELAQYTPKLEASHITVLYLHIVKIFFGAENYTKCLFWLNKILNEKHALNARPGIENNIRLLYLIVHFEKKNYNLLPSLVKSTQHYFSSKGLLFEFETCMLSFFSKKFHAITSDELIKTFKKLKNDINIITKNKKGEMPFEEFDFLSWIESKIENRSFAEVVRKKALQ